MNWPGPKDSRKLWYQPDIGWYVYRSWYDPLILASVGAFVASLAARWLGPIASEIVAGCVAAVLESGLIVLAGGITAFDTGAWVGSTVFAAGLAVVLLAVVRPRHWPLRPLPRLGAILVVAGGILLLVAVGIEDSDGRSLLSVTPLFVLTPLVPVVLAWPALAAVEARAKIWLNATVVTYAAVGVVGFLPTWIVGQSGATFLVSLVGYAVIAAGVLIRVRRPPSHP